MMCLGYLGFSDGVFIFCHVSVQSIIPSMRRRPSRALTFLMINQRYSGEHGLDWWEHFVNSLHSAAFHFAFPVI